MAVMARNTAIKSVIRKEKRLICFILNSKLGKHSTNVQNFISIRKHDILHSGQLLYIKSK